MCVPRSCGIVARAQVIDCIPRQVWIIFRHGVDVILLNDFLSYVLFSLSFLTWSGPPGHSVLFHVLRWVGGFTLLLFNLWVKTDAHRIVKDFACVVLPIVLFEKTR